MAEQADTEQPTTGGKKKLIFIIVGALLLVGISVGLTIFLLSGDKTAEPEVDPTTIKGDPSYIKLKPFTVNLDPQDSVGFLQIEIEVLTYYSKVADELEQHKPLIRNNLALLFGAQKSQDLRSPAGKLKLQQDVLGKIQEVIDQYGSGGEVDNIFFTNFVMQ